MNLHVHPDVLDSHREVIGDYRWRLAESLSGRSPWVKTLRGGPWGKTLRLRIGAQRALFSWNKEGDQLHVWIHEIDWRRQVYDRDTGLARAATWLLAKDEGRLASLGYTEVRTPPLPPTGGHAVARNVARNVVSPTGPDSDVEKGQLLPALSRQQDAFVRKVLGLGGETRQSRPFVFRAKGPPGSGKTVVATECARDALGNTPDGEGGFDVVILVPSGKLLRHYRAELLETALPQVGGLNSAICEGPPKLWISRFSEFFGSFSGEESGRSAQTDWWTKVALRLPALQRWAKANPQVHHPRFLELLDACFLDPSTTRPGSGSHDALLLHDKPYYNALFAATAGEQQAIVQSKRAAGIRFRWEVAREAEAGIRTARAGRPLIFVVDEAQDLVPAQWQSLILAAQARERNKVGTTIIALLGDENQRVSPTGFAWAAVDRFLRGLDAGLAKGADSSETELSGSFRVRREVARVANTLVDGTLGDDHARRAEVADPSILPSEGQVTVVVAPDPAAAITAAVAANRDVLGEDGRVVCISKHLPPTEGLDVLDVREAKGLEFPSVIAEGLFPVGLDWDTRSRAYVAVTRAMKRIALVLTPREWELVRKAWADDVVVSTVANLPGILHAHVDRSESDDRSVEQIIRIDNLVEEADIHDAAFPLAALERASTLVESGAGELLVAHLSDVLARRPAWHAELRRIGSDPTCPIPQRIAAWLLGGDVGAATLVATEPGVPRATTVELRFMADIHHPIAGASMELRSDAHAPADADLVDLFAAAFWENLRQGTGKNPLPAVPRYVPKLARRSDLLAQQCVLAINEAQQVALHKLAELEQHSRERAQKAREKYLNSIGTRPALKLVAAQIDTATRIQRKAN